MKTTTRLLVLLAGVATAPSILAVPITGRGTWETTLQARDLTGDGKADAYYDTSLKVTWLGNALLARALGLPDSGRMNWQDAETWVSTLKVGNVTGWRQYKSFPINGRNCTKIDTGLGIDCGFGVNHDSSEMAHLYYITLGNAGEYDKGWESYVNTGQFTNVRRAHYWSETDFQGRTDRAWNFGGDYRGQYQDLGTKLPPKGRHHVWPLIDGDVGAPVAATIANSSPAVSAVPETSTYLMMLAGLGALGVVARRRRS